jgi:hypothetical protein
MKQLRRLLRNIENRTETVIGVYRLAKKKMMLELKETTCLPRKNLN